MGALFPDQPRFGTKAFFRLPPPALDIHTNTGILFQSSSFHRSHANDVRRYPRVQHHALIHGLPGLVNHARFIRPRSISPRQEFLPGAFCFPKVFMREDMSKVIVERPRKWKGCDAEAVRRRNKDDRNCRPGPEAPQARTRSPLRRSSEGADCIGRAHQRAVGSLRLASFLCARKETAVTEGDKNPWTAMTPAFRPQAFSPTDELVPQYATHET